MTVIQSLAVLGTMTAVLAAPVSAQTSGGTFRAVLAEDSVSGSIHEEATINVVRPFMSVYNNLVIYDQTIPTTSPDTIRPELATDWSWSEDGLTLTFNLREGVKWHDGEPFTSADVKCTWDTLGGRRDAGWRKNPRGDWWRHVTEVETMGDYSVAFHLSQPQPSLLGFFASGFSPVYSCHVDGREMRTKPIGTGPFMVEQMSRGTDMTLVKNPDYWKPDRPYLDGIEWRVIPSAGTINLAFSSGELDWVPAYSSSELAAIKASNPDATCQVGLTYSAYYMLMNTKVPPFASENVRRAVHLAIDRNAFVNMSGGLVKIGTSMMPKPFGVWGKSEEEISGMPGYAGDREANLTEAKRLMEEAGYGTGNPLTIQLSHRSAKTFVETAAVVMDQLREINIVASSDVQDAAVWFANLARKTVVFAIDAKAAGSDDPDDVYATYMCGSARNESGYCAPELDKMIEDQSLIDDQIERAKSVNEIDNYIQEGAIRPMLFYGAGMTCTKPQVRGYSYYQNGQWNHWRFEDLWLDANVQ